MADGLDTETRRKILVFQRDEETGHAIYRRMAAGERNSANRAALESLAEDERSHAETLRRRTGIPAGPNRLKLFWFVLMNWIFGYTFLIRLMEKYETSAISVYRALVADWPELETIIAQEQEHELQLVEMLDEERLRYVGAMVLGLNDALVELTGTMAGLAFAMGNNRLAALAGIITGVSATLSMAASSYLAERNEGTSDALKSAAYTGAAYLVTVACLVAPYLLFPSRMIAPALLTMLAVAILIILAFNYYVSVAKSLPFTRRFLEMAGISLGVALISFLLGALAKRLLNIAEL